MYNRFIDVVSKDGFKELEATLGTKKYEKTLNAVAKLRNTVNATKQGRKELLQHGVTVEQMVYNKDTMYRYEANTLDKTINKQLEALGLTKIEGCH